MAEGKVTYLITGDNSGFKKSVDDTQSAAEKATGKINTIAKGTLLAVGAAAVGASKKAIELGKAFETSMAKASTLFGDVNVDTKELSKNMLALSSSTGLSAESLGDALYNALSAGVPATEDMSEALQYLESSAQLAKAGFTDIDTASSATIKTLNAYGLGIEEAARIQKDLIQTQNLGITTVGELGSVLAQVTPTAAAMGVNFENVSASLAVMTAQGTPAAQATTQLNSLLAELGKNGTVAAKNLEAAAAGTEYAGMSFTEMTEAGVPLNEILQMMSDYAEENNVSLLDMFSSIEAGKGALAITADMEGFTEALESMATEEDTVAQAADTMAQTTEEQLQVALAGLQAVLIDIYQNILQPLIIVLAKIATWMIDHKDLVLALTIVIVALAAGLWAYTASLAAATAGTTVFGAVTAALTSPITLVALAIGALIAVGVLLVKHWDEVKAFAIKVWDAIVEFFHGVVEKFSWEIDLIISYFRMWVDAAKTVWEMLKGIFEGIIQFVKGVFTGNWKQAWEGVQKIFGSVFEGLVGLFKIPFNFIIDGINKFIGAINNIKIPDWVPVVGGASINLPTIPRLKVGMDYVPSDLYPAYLDKGEAVLTAEEAKIWRSLGDLAIYPQPLQNYQQTKISVQCNLTGDVDMDGFKVGTIVLRNLDDAAAYTLRG